MQNGNRRTALVSSTYARRHRHAAGHLAAPAVASAGGEFAATVSDPPADRHPSLTAIRQMRKRVDLESIFPLLRVFFVFPDQLMIGDILFRCLAKQHRI